MSRAPDNPAGCLESCDGSPLVLRLVPPPEVSPRHARLFSFSRSVLVAGVVVSPGICLGAFHRVSRQTAATVAVEDLPVLVAESVSAEEQAQEDPAESRPERIEEVRPPAPPQTAAVMVSSFERAELPAPEVEAFDGEPIESLSLRDDPAERLFPPKPSLRKPETPITRKPSAPAKPPRSRVAAARSAVKKAATLLRRVPPSYPVRARQAGVEGRVLLAVVVRRDGRVHEVSLVSSSGNGLLDSAAMRAVRKWFFQPATLNGRAVDSQLRVPVRFELR